MATGKQVFWFSYLKKETEEYVLIIKGSHFSVYPTWESLCQSSKKKNPSSWNNVDFILDVEQRTSFLT